MNHVSTDPLNDGWVTALLPKDKMACLHKKKDAEQRSPRHGLTNNTVGLFLTNNNTNSSDPINTSSNVLLVFRLQEMRQSSNLNFWLAVGCLIYCGVNTVLLFINYANSRAEKNGTEPAVSDQMFHGIEFWATFAFAVMECLSLVLNQPKSLVRIYQNPLILKLILFFNIVATWIPALLVSLNLERFEIISHEIEYLNELTMSFVDLVLLWSLCQFDQSNNNSVTSLGSDQTMGRQWFLPALAAVIAFGQLGVYNLMGMTNDGDMVGEVPAHYLEFVFEIVSSLILFWWCIDNKFVAEHEIGLILYGKHKDCTICDDKTQEFTQTYPISTSARSIADSSTNGLGNSRDDEAILSIEETTCSNCDITATKSNMTLSYGSV